MSQLYNHIKVKCPNPEPEMGATLILYTDRQAYTIIEVDKSGNSFKMQRDRADRVDSNGMSECQKYKYTRNKDEAVCLVRKANDGQWYTKGGSKVIVGRREEYHDFSF